MATGRVAAGVLRHADVTLAAGCLAAGVMALVAAANGHASAVDLDVVRLGAWLAGPIAGAVILDHRPGHLGGRLLALLGLLPVLALLAATWHGGGLPDIATASAEAPALTIPAVALLVGVVATFPHGIASGRGMHLALAALVIGGFGLAATAARAGWRGRSVPPAVSAVLDGVAMVSLAALVVTLSAALALQWSQQKTAARPERDRRRWLIAGVLLGGAALLGVVSVDGGVTTADSTYALVGLEVTGIVGIATLSLVPHAPPFDFALARAALLALVTLILAATYLSALAALATTNLPDQPAAAAAATALAALLLLPVYAWARVRLAVRLYGLGRQPTSVLSFLRTSMRTDGEAADALQKACDAVAAAVRSPRASIVMSGAVEDAGVAAVLPLVAGGEQVGSLVVEPRRPGEPFSRRDLALIDSLSAPVAQLVRTVALAGALDRARTDLAVQRLDERRRLRRDLHDGLGPLLATLGLQLAALGTQPDEKLHPLQGVLARCRDEVRRLVEGLAPEPSEDSDLAHALTELVGGWGSATAPSGLRIDLAVAPSLPAVEPDVRTAVYRVAGEAITNVVRHARATRCNVRLGIAPGGDLLLEVEDDGIGLQQPGGGFGLQSMHERARALRGSVEAVASPAGGTVVRLRLPTGRAT